MKTLIPSLLAASLVGGGMTFSGLALASTDEHHGYHDSHHNNKDCPYHKGWKKDLTDEQRKKYDALRADYKKDTMAIREKMRVAKVALAKEISKDKPSQKAIDKQIDASLKLKKEKMKRKVAYKIAVRKILNKEQKVKFDEYLLYKAEHGRKGMYYGGMHHGDRGPHHQ